MNNSPGVETAAADVGGTSPSAERRSPLARFELARAEAESVDAGLRLAELPGRTHINIRLDANNRSAANALKRATGMSLPRIGMYSKTEAAYLGWLSPDEFLLVTDQVDSSSTMTTLRNQLAKFHHALNDMSSGQTIVRISGENSAGVLAKGCTLDLHGNAFVTPMCAQTRIAKTQTFLRAVDAGVYDVIVRRSFSDYFWTWLINAARDTNPTIGAL